MLSRFFLASSTRPLRFRSLTLTLIYPPPSAISFPSPSAPPLPRAPPAFANLWPTVLSRAFSSKRTGGGNGDGGGTWKLTGDAEDAESLFEPAEGDLAGVADDRSNAGGPVPNASHWVDGGGEWSAEGEGEEKKGNIFDEIDREVGHRKEGAGGGGGDEWATAEGFKPWGFDEEEGKGDDLFAVGEREGVGDLEGFGNVEDDNRKAEEMAKLELQEKELKEVLKGPNRAFGDLIAASGITDEMLDSLILLKDVSGIEGLPSLREIEDIYIEKSDGPTRFEEERQKQQEIAKARVKQVDEKGRAYGTGRRKCSIARVFIQPGDGKFVINDKQFDAYFPCLDHRADLLSPFMVTNTIGRWDVNCTVKGGGLSGQVGAIRLGISRALQNFEPGFREYLRPEGLLTRDPRVVERKKPGKAKARKSFQWVKR